jgi:hypothetical protein
MPWPKPARAGRSHLSRLIENFEHHHREIVAREIGPARKVEIGRQAATGTEHHFVGVCRRTATKTVIGFWVVKQSALSGVLR